MPIACEFEYHRPETLAEALKLLSRYGAGGSVLAGGTDLLVWLKEDLRAPEAVVDVKRIPELSRLELKAGRLHIGACVTFSQLLESDVVREKAPLLWDCSRTVASNGVRNRATLAGNICSAVPSADSAPALLVYEASVRVGRHSGACAPLCRREIPIDHWFVGPKKTALKPGELVLGVTIPLLQGRAGACYVKLGRYSGEDLAQVGLGILAMAGGTYRLAYCAVGPIPARARKIEALLRGKPLTDELVRRAKALVEAEIRPVTDIRASKEYRLRMAKVMLERGLKAAAARLSGGRGRVPPARGPACDHGGELL